MTPRAGQRQRGVSPLPPWVPAAATAMGLAVGLALSASGCQPVEPTHVQVDAASACMTCHRDEYGAASQPLHIGAISTECSQCHDETQWAPALGSDHPLPLRGRHAETGCNNCHGLELAVYTGTPGTCIDCHAADLAGVTEPSHEDFGWECAECHSESAWRPASLEHKWPLEGAHQAATCAECHLGKPPVYEGTPTECIACHVSDRLQATEPPHDNFSDNCGDCHNPAAWQPASFPDHKWPLEGAHQNATCAECHLGEPPVYESTPTECIACHVSDRLQATQPPHNDFPEDCSTCHSPESWSGATFEHIESFPLQGGHAEAECAACHSGSPAVFAGLDAACVSCHESDAEAVSSPDHESFPPTCESCHSIEAWQPATGGEHPTDRFSLRGNHDFACNECHKPELGAMGSGNTDCVGCHTGAHDLGRMDSRHTFIFGYPRGAGRPANFCLSCHRDGR